MAEKLGLRNEIRELKIGQSFTNPKSTAFHTIKYDFKPASVDTNKKATVDVARNNEVTVTVPHLDGAGVPQTLFKGSQRPYQKECVLIIDRVTGEITLEKLSCNVQVKKTRSECNKMHLPNDRLSQSSSSLATDNKLPTLSHRSQTPPSTMVGQRVSNKTKVASGRQQRVRASAPPPPQQHHLIPKHSPMHASPSYQRSPMHTKSPRRDISQQSASLHPSSQPSEPHSQSTLASLPMISGDDFSDIGLSSQNTSHSSHNSHTLSFTSNEKTDNSFQISDNENGVGEITDTSSSSSDSDSDSDEDTTIKSKNPALGKANGYSNGTGALKLDTQILNDDLCLSESGSDSD